MDKEILVRSMKLAIFSHCTIDSICGGGQTVEAAGGPASYCSITARRMGFDVDLFTKVGHDFKFKNDLEKRGIFLSQNSMSDKPTTRFFLKLHGMGRELYLQTKCEEIEFRNSDADGVIVSPVFDEVSEETLDRIKDNFNFLLLDPQGFLRRIDSNNKIYLEKNFLDLSNVTAIKVDPEEAFCLSGLREKDAMIALQKRGAKHVLYTNRQEITMLVRDRMYHLRLPDVKINDTTGVGDIFCAAFACSYLKEKDSLWAICFAVGSAQAALDTKASALDKIPNAGQIQQNAAYLYNLVKFSQV